MKSQKSNFPIRFSLIMIFSLLGSSMFGQSTQSLLWEPEVSFDVATESRWSYSFGIANRTLFYIKEDGKKIADQNQEHLELNQFTGYRLSENTAIALGFRYRFAELFNEERYDEFRIIQQLTYAPENALNLRHRFRLEERFRNVITVFRPRYAISIEQPLSEDFAIGVGTEVLYSMAQGVAPELDQRFSIEIENSSFEDVELSLGLEYQYENYLNTPEGELFIQSGISFEL